MPLWVSIEKEAQGPKATGGQMDGITQKPIVLFEQSCLNMDRINALNSDLESQIKILLKL